MDMDIDELLDAQKQPQARPSRFAPKGSKPKLKPEPKPEPPSSSASLPLSVPKKEEPKHENSGVAMDVERNPGDEEVEKPDDSMETEAAEVGFQPGDEDEIVREIEVYFSPSVDPKTQLYLFQYPLRPVWRPYALDDTCEEVRVKSATSEVEIDLAIDVDSKNYDAQADRSVQMKKQTLAAKWKPQKIGGCTVGVLSENKIHLNPIHAVVQLRPHYDEKKESEKKTAVRNNVEDLVKSEDHQEGKLSKLPKTPKAQEQTKDAGDVWVPLKYHSMSSDMAAGYLEKIIQRGGSPIHFSTSSHDYLNSLCPATASGNSSSNVTQRRNLLALPLKERLKTSLLQGLPLRRFTTLKHLAPDESTEEVLAVLQELAVLVQGLWVAKTSVVYESDNETSVSAKDQAIRASSRDNVLLLFSKNVIISNSELPSNPHRANAMKAVLHGLATERPSFKDWKLKELPDLSFIKHYPAVVKKQQEMWESIEKKFNALNSAMKTSKSSAPTNSVVSKGSDKIAARTSDGSAQKNELSVEVRESIKKSLHKIFRSTKTCSFQNIRQKLREIAVSESARATGFAKGAVTAANCTDDFPDELQAILNEVAVNIHGICVLKSSPDHPQYDDLRKVVIDLFLAEGPNSKLKRASINEAANMKLEKAMGDAAYKKVLSDLCVSQGSSWILRSADHLS